MKKPVFWLIKFTLVLTLSGCYLKQCPSQSKHSQPYSFEEEKDTALTGAEVRKLFERDLETLEHADPKALKDYDFLHKDRFKQIFRGYSGPEIKKFFDERIKLAVTFDDKVTLLSPEKFEITNWYKESDPIEQEKQKENDKKAEVMAFNWGAFLWFDGLVNNKEVILNINNDIIPVHTSRVGIMGFGTGYKEKIRTANGYYELPSSFRHEILLHEARHSDCTGGITERDLDVVRNARNPREFDETFQKKQCVHFHVRCPEGHPLSGVFACDAHPWGAYSISAIYSEARRYNFDLPIEEWSLLDAVSIDMKSRILVDFNDMIAGAYGDPDLSHSEAM